MILQKNEKKLPPEDGPKHFLSYYVWPCVPFINVATQIRESAGHESVRCKRSASA